MKSSTPTEAIAPLMTPEAATEAQMIARLLERRTDLLQRLLDIETALGFVADDAALAVRVARIEQFLGLKG
jgi:hypothetical protein